MPENVSPAPTASTAASAPASLPGALDAEIDKLPSRDKKSGHAEFAHMVAKALREERFEDLENAAARLRRTPFVSFADGTPCLAIFYSGLGADEAYGKTPESWAEWRRVFDRWAAAFPQSATRPVAEAGAFIALAWHRRGGGSAREVEGSGWTGFFENLAISRKLLEEAPRACPHRFAALQTVAMGQNWGREEYEKLYQAATTEWPGYLPYYERKAIYLLPRWHGRTGEIAAWAQSEARSNRSGLGASIYAIIAEASSSYTLESESMLRVDGFEWAPLRESLRALVAATPRSAYNAFRATHWAWRCNDKETAHEFFRPVANEPRGGSFTEGELRQMKAWLGVSKPALETVASIPFATYASRPERDGMILALRATPDGRHVVAGDLGGTVTLLSLPSLKLVAQNATPDDAGRLQISPDGSRIAAGSCSRISEIFEFDAATLAQVGEPVKITGELTDFAYATNDSFVCALGSYEEPPRVLLVSAQGESRVVEWLRAEKSFRPEISLFRSGHQAAFTDPGGIAVYDLKQESLLRRVRSLQGQSPRRVAFRSDGQAFAYVTQTDGAPSTLELWQGPEWTPESVLSRQGPAGYVSCMAWSPDHRWIAVGGDTGQIWLWPAKGGEARLVGENMRWIRAIEFSPDGRWLISGSDDHLVRVWDLGPLSEAPPFGGASGGSKEDSLVER